MTTEKDKALELAIDQIEKQFGQGAIMRFNDSAHLSQIAVIPTGSVALDIALGVGGLPRGRVTEIFGPESTGKTTLAQHIIAEAQKLGGRAAYIDVEHALDPAYAKTCGINLDDLLISQPDTGEEALEICETLVLNLSHRPVKLISGHLGNHLGDFHCFNLRGGIRVGPIRGATLPIHELEYALMIRGKSIQHPYQLTASECLKGFVHGLPSFSECH